ncbi:MAG: DUF6268 family outer membrane beta-barrel protein [Ignavibacteriales bacterium]|nr:DUF6268 family outer membrane beta-barrel protein [Ignavibacteriales bacterium]
MNRVLAAILLITSSSLAQESLDNSPLSGMIGVSFGRIPQTNFATDSGTYESRWSWINAVVPIYRSINLAEDERSFQQIALTGSLRRNTTELSIIAEPRIITTAWLGGSWSYIGESKNLYLISGSLGTSEDKLISGPPTIRFRLMAMGTYRLSDPLHLMYGVNYSALFGRDLLLPIVGLRWTINDDWSSTVILPFSFSLRYLAGKSVTLQANISAAGERMRIANNGDYAVSSNDLQLRTTGAKIAVRCAIKLSDAFGLNTEIGSISRRTLTILSGTTTLATKQLDASGYFSLGIQYRFSAGDNAPADAE